MTEIKFNLKKRRIICELEELVIQYPTYKWYDENRTDIIKIDVKFYENLKTTPKFLTITQVTYNRIERKSYFIADQGINTDKEDLLYHLNSYAVDGTEKEFEDFLTEVVEEL
jgi:hypothetical protein